jgi:threonine/homoserine/homoserine lactone efflux protein
MFELLPSWPHFSAFLLASLILAITPGPGVLYIVGRSLVQGRGSGLASVAGVALGNFANAVAAACGLAALFAVSAWAYTLLKYAGAGYLVYLGIRMWRRPPAFDAAALPARQSLARVFRQGMLVALLNPKTTLFYAAFLPQFLTPGQAPLAQSLFLAGLFVAIAAFTDSLYALAAGRVTARFSRRWGCTGRRLGGGLFVGLGIVAACSGQRSA